MLTAYFKLSMNLVRDVVKIMEEGIMENFDDEASKPVSSVFAAPIPSGNNDFDEKDKKGKSGYDDNDLEDEYSEINVSTGDLNISYEKAKEKTGLFNEVIYEDIEDQLSAADADINKIKKKLNFEENIDYDRTLSKKNSVSLVIPSKSASASNNNSAANSAIPSSSTSAPTSSNPYNKLRKRSSINLSADTSSALQTQANLITKINKNHHYEALRRSNNLPIMEAMSQDTIEEVVNKTFALANAKSNDYLTFEEFQKVAESDITILAWFEALGSVF